MKLFPVILAVLVLQSSVSSAQIFSLSISYNSAEKSKDSHSYTETFSIIERSISYSVKYSGPKSPRIDDEAKACTFTSEQISKIQQTMIDKNLNVMDSLINISTGMNSVAISISMTKDGNQSKIKLRGDPVEISDKTLYKNSMYLILSIKKMLADCR
jgi:hypothetical protein